MWRILLGVLISVLFILSTILEWYPYSSKEILSRKNLKYIITTVILVIIIWSGLYFIIFIK